MAKFDTSYDSSITVESLGPLLTPELAKMKEEVSRVNLLKTQTTKETNKNSWLLTVQPSEDTVNNEETES
jgi:hypothetical protein